MQDNIHEGANPYVLYALIFKFEASDFWIFTFGSATWY
jgi:hypothetical protein